MDVKAIPEYDYYRGGYEDRFYLNEFIMNALKNVKPGDNITLEIDVEVKETKLCESDRGEKYLLGGFCPIKAKKKGK